MIKPPINSEKPAPIMPPTLPFFLAKAEIAIYTDSPAANISATLVMSSSDFEFLDKFFIMISFKLILQY